MINEINKLRKEKNAVILAHYYVAPELQDIADCVGDSLALARYAEKTEADIIVFCGVYFMAETAKILNPDKKVLIPDINAGCSLADSCCAGNLQKLKDENPNAIVVSYINCTAEIKAISDIICTSGNALDIVKSIDADKKIIFAPDKNLGNYINRSLGRKMILWEGSCHVHNQLQAENILQMKQKYGSAKILAHPECIEQVQIIADFVGSTAAMLQFVNTDDAENYIVATESGIAYRMQKQNPDKHFIIVPADKTCACNDCEYMKLNTVKKLLDILKTEKNEVLLSEELMTKAKKPLLRMLQ